MKRKNEVPMSSKSLIRTLQSKGKKVKYIRCNNAEECKPLKKYREENGITLEMTAINTPQHNRVLERSFETDMNCITAMLYQANFTAEMATKLWGMALLYLQQTRNMLSTMENKDKLSPNIRFNNEDNLNIEELQPFGRIDFNTIRSRMKKTGQIKLQSNYGWNT